MALQLAKIRNDFAKHKAKAAVLCTLSLTMVVLVIKGVFDMMPSSASAESAPAALAAGSAAAPMSPASETEDRARQGQQLWRLLRQRRGIGPAEAFTFDASYFTPDPNRRIPAAAAGDPRAEATPERPATRPVTSEEAERARKTAAVTADANLLIVRSTIVGGAKPVAIINGRVLSVGEHILDFEVLAIHAREVVVRKDDVTLAVQMAGDARSQ